MNRRRLVKLVRDRVGELLPHTQVEYTPIKSRRQVIRELRKKLVEEATEYLLDPTLDELADVHEVVRALAELDLGVSLDGVITEARHKREERGGFQDGMGMYAYTTAPTRHEGDHAHD